jgi:fatty acid desaturase
MRTLRPWPATSTMPTPIPARLNLALALALLALHAIVLVALPLWLLPLHPAWLALLLPLALLSPTLWSLIHEAIHGLLHPRPGINAGLGRALAIVFGAPLRPLAFAHLRHHRYNRTSIARDEVYVASRTPRWWAWMDHQLRLNGGLYLAELLLNLLVWLPRGALARMPFLRHPPEWPQAAPGAQRLAERELLAAGARWEMRRDALIVLTLYGLAFWLFGPWWPALLAALLVRGFLVSALDNAYHHATPLVDPARRDDTHLFALNLEAGPWVRALLLNMNLHRAHHRNARLPWNALPAHADRDPRDLPFWRGLRVQWRGPVEAGALAPGRETQARSSALARSQ